MISLDAMPIELANGKGYAWVSPEDHAEISKLSWSAKKSQTSKSLYAYGGKSLGRGAIYMHSLILGFPEWPRLTVDHIDGNGLNNTRQNLRIATYQQNGANRGLNANNSTGLKGVSADPHGGWRARISLHRRTRQLGTFDTPDAAARVRDAWAKAAYGEFAVLNFPGAA